MVGLQPGDVIAGKYRVERVLGEGGMGVVLSARHTQLHQNVAIKLMRAGAIGQGEAMARFLREARAAAAIESDHVCRVLDVGQLDDGAPFIVMEHLRGSDLGALLAERGPLPLADAVDAVLQACEALAEAHAVGVVHRDLKPANLFLAMRNDGSARVKVLDFGISTGRADDVADDEKRLTRKNTTLGSPLYMSPEQMRSARDVDHRADIWALGAILHELLSGHPPFDGETLTEICTKIVSDPPAPISGLPAPVEAAIRRCLEKSRDARFSDVAELATALAPFGTGAGRGSVERAVRLLRGSVAGAARASDAVAATVSADAPGATIAAAISQVATSGARQAATTPMAHAATTAAPVPSRRAAPIAAAATAVVALALAAGLGWRSRASTPAGGVAPALSGSSALASAPIPSATAEGAQMAAALGAAAASASGAPTVTVAPLASATASVTTPRRPTSSPASPKRNDATKAGGTSLDTSSFGGRE